MALPTFTGTGKSGAAAGADVCSPDPPPAVPLVGFVLGATLPDGLAEADRDAEGDTDGEAEAEGGVEGDAEAEVEGEAETEADGLADAEPLLVS
ncbi:hypothetical protein ACPCAE_09115 [Streptomyces cinereoruber]|uniref:hypothetical protein n=1 Tax=Streptomyces cinereoruber TaxID=67260 RepID=UPI0036390BA0